MSPELFTSTVEDVLKLLNWKHYFIHETTKYKVSRDIGISRIKLNLGQAISNWKSIEELYCHGSRWKIRKRT